MNINEKVLNRIKAIVKIGDETVLACMKVGHISKNKTIRACFFATEFEMMVLEKVTHEGQLQVVEKFFWNEVASLSAPSDSKFIVEAKSSTVEIETPGAYAIASDVYSCVSKFTSNCQVDSATTQKIKLRKPTAFSGLERFKFALFKNGISAPNSLVSGIELAIRQQKNTLDLYKLRCSDKYLSELLNVIELMPCFTHIIFPASANDSNWDIIHTFLLRTKNIESIAFTEKLNEKALACISSLHDCHNGKLQELVFMKSGITKDNVEYVKKFICAKKIPKIVFDDAIDQSYYADFFSEIGRVDAISNIESITFKNMNNLPADTAMTTFANSINFEFINCNTEIDKIVSFFQKTNIKSISVDGCTANNGKLIYAATFSPNISALTFSHCKWESYSFISMWCKILEIKPAGYPIKMDLSYAQSAPQVWQQFFQSYCGSPTKSIESINWSGNPVQDQFMRFLTESQNLHYLTLDGCFNAQNSDVMINFAGYMYAKTCITSLSVCGNETARADNNNFAVFLKKLANYQGLRQLNVSGQIIGDNGLEALLTLLMKNKKIDKLQYDGRVDTSYESLINFYNSIQQRGAKIDLEWPFLEIAKLRTKESVSVTSINKLRLAYKIACNAGRSVEPLTEIEEELPGFAAEEALNSSLEEFGNSSIWKISLPAIPEPDNGPILQSAASKYSISSLLNNLRQSE